MSLEKLLKNEQVLSVIKNEFESDYVEQLINSTITPASVINGLGTLNKEDLLDLASYCLILLNPNLYVQERTQSYLENHSETKALSLFEEKDLEKILKKIFTQDVFKNKRKPKVTASAANNPLL